MDILGYGYRGGQKDFAKTIGVGQGQFNSIFKGRSGLSTNVAFAIYEKFPAVSLEFLWFGHAGRGGAEFEQKLREWEREKDQRIFEPLVPPG